MAILEKHIQKQIISYLLTLEKQDLLFFTRLNTVGIFNGKRYLKPVKGTKKGVSDIVVFSNNFTFWIEVKKKDGKILPEQKIFDLAVKKFSGGYYYIVRDFSFAKKVIDSFVFDSLPYKTGINFG